MELFDMGIASSIANHIATQSALAACHSNSTFRPGGVSLSGGAPNAVGLQDHQKATQVSLAAAVKIKLQAL